MTGELPERVHPIRGFDPVGVVAKPQPLRGARAARRGQVGIKEPQELAPHGLKNGVRHPLAFGRAPRQQAPGGPSAAPAHAFEQEAQPFVEGNVRDGAGLADESGGVHFLGHEQAVRGGQGRPKR